MSKTRMEGRSLAETHVSEDTRRGLCLGVGGSTMLERRSKEKELKKSFDRAEAVVFGRSLRAV